MLTFTEYLDMHNVNKIEYIYRNSSNIYQELYEYFMSKCKFTVLTTYLSEYFQCFRVREIEDTSEIKTKKDLGYRPTAPDYFSRVAKSGQNLLYLSDGQKTAFAEMMQKWYFDKTNVSSFDIVVAEWSTKAAKQIKVIIIPDFEQKNNVCKEIDLSAYEEDKWFWSYISLKFRTLPMHESDIYKFTAAFSNAILDKSNEDVIDGIVYPSVQYPEKVNIALQPYVQDKNMISLGKHPFKVTLHNTGELTKERMPKYEIREREIFAEFDSNSDTIKW